ncbi:MAG: glycosyltransferase family 1 protein [Bacteroidaceae bacterium]|nr:glycosyltransferase family 1 protein [Bacteroidaceae bacterium]
MRILLLGDYSNVHATLAKGLRELGHEVTVASDGDGWKNYPRDVDLRRDMQSGRLSDIRYYFHMLRTFFSLRNYDVVQLINPVFLPLKAERHAPFYKLLRCFNKRIFMGAFGMDHYWVKTGLDCTTFRYSDFNLGCEVRESYENDIWIADWLRGPKGEWNQYVAKDCDAIVAGLYEYHASYISEWKEKLTFIPMPIQKNEVNVSSAPPKRVRFFIGIQRKRSAYKGTDIMLRALERVVSEFPEQCEMVKVESVPFAEYVKLMNDSHVILDQLYSYTPAMNALEAMSQGLIVVGGGEPENYEILNETTLHPIINVEPNEESVYQALKDLVLHPERIPQLQCDSIAYIARHHDHLKVAQQYLDWWSKF